MDQTPGLGPAGRTPCSKPCSSRGDTQEMSLSSIPLRRRHGQAKHPNREVTLRYAAPIKEYEAWPLTRSRSPQATHSFSRHLMITGTEGGPVGFWECRVRGRVIKDKMFELAPRVGSWFQRKLRKKISLSSFFHIFIRL